MSQETEKQKSPLFFPTEIGMSLEEMSDSILPEKENATISKLSPTKFYEKLNSWTKRTLKSSQRHIKPDTKIYQTEGLKILSETMQHEKRAQYKNRGRFVLIAEDPLREENLLFAQEGIPDNFIPSHAGMVAKGQHVYAAGTVYFDLEGRIAKIDNKSGGFQLPLDSLLPVVHLLARSKKIHLADQLIIRDEVTTTEIAFSKADLYSLDDPVTKKPTESDILKPTSLQATPQKNLSKSRPDYRKMLDTLSQPRSRSTFFDRLQSAAEPQKSQPKTELETSSTEIQEQALLALSLPHAEMFFPPSLSPKKRYLSEEGFSATQTPVKRRDAKMAGRQNSFADHSPSQRSSSRLFSLPTDTPPHSTPRKQDLTNRSLSFTPSSTG